jgi:hypothetical protein
LEPIEICTKITQNIKRRKKKCKHSFHYKTYSWDQGIHPVMLQVS